jgi:hypothetical protein
MVKNPDGHQGIVDKLGRKIARAITLLIEAFGFEVVKVKPSECKSASIRLIRPVSAGNKPRPVLRGNGFVETNKYFTINVGCEAGINHMKSALSLLIKESLSLNRTPLVFTPNFLASHNFGKEIDASWDRYIDLDRIAVVKDGASTTYVRALKRDVIDDLDAVAVLEVKGKHFVTAAENATYRLIVKNNPSGLGSDGVYGHDDFDFDVDLRPSCIVSSCA